MSFSLTLTDGTYSTTDLGEGSNFLSNGLDFVMGLLDSDKNFTHSEALWGAVTVGVAGFVAGSMLGRRRMAAGKDPLLGVFA